MKINFIVNGRPIHLETQPQRRLLDILREDLALTGTKESCGRGECGSCTVLMNGVRVNSCLVPALQLDGSRVTTIEGLREWPVYPRIERAFIEHGSVQCGFCIPGYLVSTAAALCELPAESGIDAIRDALAGNLCRCTGYEKILGAIEEMAAEPPLRDQLMEIIARERA